MPNGSWTPLLESGGAPDIRIMVWCRGSATFRGLCVIGGDVSLVQQGVCACVSECVCVDAHGREPQLQ